MKNSILQINKIENTIRKSISRNGIDLEIKMTKAARELAVTSGLFQVPKIKDYSLEQNWIDFEYFENIIPLKKLLNDKTPLKKIIPSVAQCLAQIHDNLDLGEENKYVIPSEISFGVEEINFVFLHADFNLENVQYDLSTEKIVIIDWSLTPLLDKSANWGTRYWDICWMINSIIVMPPFVLSRNAFRESLADSFIKNYLEYVKADINVKYLDNFLFDLSHYFYIYAKNHLKWIHFLRQRKNRKNFIKYASKPFNYKTKQLTL